MALDKNKESRISPDLKEAKLSPDSGSGDLTSGENRINQELTDYGGVGYETATPSSVELNNGINEASSGYSSKQTEASAPYFSASDPAYQSYKQIENILEDGLGEMYSQMSPIDQRKFKSKGEEVAKLIFQMVYHKTKIKVKKIISLIRSWLKIIPGVNRFFLEQEAKIKADRIIALANDDKKIKF